MCFGTVTPFPHMQLPFLKWRVKFASCLSLCTINQSPSCPASWSLTCYSFAKINFLCSEDDTETVSTLQDVVALQQVLQNSDFILAFRLIFLDGIYTHQWCIMKISSYHQPLSCHHTLKIMILNFEDQNTLTTMIHGDDSAILINLPPFPPFL